MRPTIENNPSLPILQRGWILTIPEPRGFWDYFPRLAPIPEGIPGVRGLRDFPGDPRQIRSRYGHKNGEQCGYSTDRTLDH